MAEKVVNMIIQLRNDTKANFEKVKDTLVLRSGECAVITDYSPEGAGIVLGDGVKKFSELPVITHKNGGSGTGTEIVGDNKTIEIVEGVAKLYGFDETKKGMSFKVNADGTAIEWFIPAGKDEVDGQVESLNQTVTNNKTLIESLQTEVGAVKDNLANNYYNKSEIDNKISGAFKYMGAVQTKQELEAIVSAERGQVYQVIDEDKMYVFNGTSWDDFGVTIDTSNFVENTAFTPVKNKVDSLPQKLVSGLTLAQKNGSNITYSSTYGELQPDGTYQEKTNSSALTLDIANDTQAGLLGAEDKTKLDSVEKGAQANLIDSMSIAGVKLDINDKNVDLPMSTDASLGMVKSGDGTNKVKVLPDGTMEIVGLSMDKLVQGSDDIILNGGGAAG